MTGVKLAGRDDLCEFLHIYWLDIHNVYLRSDRERVKAMIDERCNATH
jgi:hypothetical protein